MKKTNKKIGISLFDEEMVLNLCGKLTSVLTFAKRNIENLHTNSANWDENYHDTIKWSDKIIAETALLTLLSTRLGRNWKFIKHCDEIAKLLESFSRTNRYKSEILKSPKSVTTFGLAHIALSEMGYKNDDFDFVVTNAFASNKFDISEKIPFRGMDLKWIHHIFNATNTPNFDELIKLSIISTNTSALYMTIEDEYALTHSIFYLTNFGSNNLSDLVEKNRLIEMLDNSLTKNLLTENLDILGELLICSVYCESTNSTSFILAFEYYMSIWADLGLLYSPSFNIGEFSSLDGIKKSAYSFKNIYHTYYVGGILCFSLLQYKNRQKKAVKKGTEKVVGKFDELTSRLDDVSAKAFNYCNAYFKISENTFNDLKIFSSGSIQEEENENLIEKKISQFPELRILFENSVLNEKEINQILLDSLLIEFKDKYDLLNMIEVLLEFIKQNISVSHIFIEAVDFLLMQRTMLGSVTGALFFQEINFPEESKLVVELKIANSYIQISEFLKNYK